MTTPPDKNRLSLATLLASLALTCAIYVSSRTHLYKVVIGRMTDGGHDFALDRKIADAHLLYIVGLILIAPLCFSVTLLVQRWQMRWLSRPETQTRLQIVLYVLWIGTALYVSWSSNFTLYSPVRFFHEQIILWSALIIVFSILFFCSISHIHTIFRHFSSIILIFTLILEITHLSLIYYIGFNSVNPTKIYEDVFWVDFNASFHSVVQAWSGKMGLLDYYAQYGYYSIFFGLIPHTLTAYSLTIVGMSVISLLCLFICLRIANVSLPIAVLATSSVLYTCSVAFVVYWANLPIRIIFPSFGLLLIFLFIKTGKFRFYYAIFGVAALSLLWNLDTGVVLLLSWLITLAYIRSRDARSLRQWSAGVARDVLLAGLCVAILAGAYAFYVFLLRGAWPHFENLLIFQKTFFGQGIVAVPIKLVDDWVLVMLVYVSGLVYACNSLLESRLKHVRNDERAAFIFFLAIFGLGAFSYYVMRSWSANIRIVAWPAILITAIYADELLRRHHRITAALFVLPFLAWSAQALDMSLTNWQANDSYTPPQPTDQQREWLNSLHLSGRDVIILSDYSGLFYLDTHANCPLAIPGATELVIPSFTKMIRDYTVAEHATPGFILVDTRELLGISYMSDILSGLPLVAQSPDGTLTLYSTKPPQSGH